MAEVNEGQWEASIFSGVYPTFIDPKRELAENAFLAGESLVNWLEKSGRECDHPGYEDFEEWWAQQ